MSKSGSLLYQVVSVSLSINLSSIKQIRGTLELIFAAALQQVFVVD